jgi:adenosylmethionine-8-amino-7-oxononanoate aminotransferase
MSQLGNTMDENSQLILHHTPRADIKNGITIMSKGEGVHLIDREGNKYIDLMSGITRPVHLGYGNKELAQAIYDQVMELSYFTPMMFANEPAIKLAQVLSEIAPGSINRFIFECSGSEAVETSMKIAKHYHYFNGDKGRFKVLSRKGAYHGVNGIGVRALGALPGVRHMMEPLAPGKVFAESPYCYRCPYDRTYPECDILCARNIERIIEFEGMEFFSAVIGEPIQQGFGALAPPEGYWHIIRDICDKYGILLIIDEVICGFGRTGTMFGIEHFGIEPDIITMAKGITSGYVPLGAVGCTDKLMEPVELFNHVHTYGNHPVSCAAGLKTIEIMARENLVEKSRNMGAYFLEGLKAFESRSIVGEVRGTGLFAGIDFTADKKTRAPLPVENLVSMIKRAKRKGLIIKLAPMRMALEFAPPLNIEKDIIDEALKILEETITEEERELSR